MTNFRIDFEQNFLPHTVAKSALRRYVINQFSDFDAQVSKACKDFEKLATLNPDRHSSREESFGIKFNLYQQLKDESLALLDRSLRKLSSTRLGRVEQQFIDIFAKAGRFVYALVGLARNPEASKGNSGNASGSSLT